MSLAERLREARRKAVDAVWILGPWAVTWPVLLAAGLWRRWTGAPFAGGGLDMVDGERAVSPYRVADPPAYFEEPELPPEAPRPAAPDVPLPGPPTPWHK